MSQPNESKPGPQPAIRFEEALAYPFREQNRPSLIWLPGGVLFLVQVVFFILGVLGYLVFVMPQDDADAKHQMQQWVNGVLQAANMGVMFIVSIPISGYLWRLMGQWRSGRPDDHPPSWFNASCILDGLKLLLYYIVAGFIILAPVILFVMMTLIFWGVGFNVLDHLKTLGYAAMVFLVLVSTFLLLAFWFLVSPFIYAPVVLSSPNRTLSSLFAFFPAWRTTLHHYPATLQAMLWIIVTSLLLLVADVLVMCLTCCLGAPFLRVPYQIVVFRLINQAFPTE